jgi:CubicO group peptidase (beta-lactamase class C family)
MSKLFGEWPLRFQPGSHWLYSHGMDIAARLVEIMSGLPYDEYLRTAIFEPLGMADTEFWVPADKVDRFAACYARNERKELVLVDDPTASSYLRTPKLFNGGGRCSPTAARSAAGACWPARRSN